MDRPDVECARASQRKAAYVQQESQQQRPVDARIIATLQADAVRPERQQRGHIPARIGSDKGEHGARLLIEVQRVIQRVVLERGLVDETWRRSMEFEQA